MSISHANLDNEKKKKRKNQNESRINLQISNLERKKENLDKEIDDLEKDYLKKIAKLLVMTQVHCEVKTEIYNEFNKLGITEIDKDVGANSDQSFNNKY